MNRVKIPRNLVGEKITSSKESFLNDSDYYFISDTKFKIGEKVIYGYGVFRDKKESSRIVDIFKIEDEDETYIKYQVGYGPYYFLEEDLELDEDENEILKRLVNG